MQRHTFNYYTKFNYTQGDVILCEVCNAVAVDIHHVIPRSKFGSKRKHEQDHWSNLIALCHHCHTISHQGPGIRQFNDKLKELVAKRNVL